MPSAAEKKALEKIEAAIGKKLEQLEEVDFSTGKNGHTLDKQGHIVGLSLYDNRFSDLSSLRDLRHLVELDLSSNQISDLAKREGVSNGEWLSRGSGASGSRLPDRSAMIPPTKGSSFISKAPPISTS